MKREFARYGLSKYRSTVGILQLIGAIALIYGLFYNVFLMTISSFGLALLMFLGYGVRLRIKDSFWNSFPALFYALLNTVIALLSL